MKKQFNTYTIRPLTPTDIDAVMVIDKLSFPTPARRQMLEHELEQNELAEYMGLFLAAELVGYIGCWTIGDEVHITTIAVHPDWRDQGLGKLLLLRRLLSAYEQPVTMVTLEVREHNEVAQALYQSLQFERVGRRRRYYRDTGEDALIMTRSPLDAPYHNFLQQAYTAVVARLGSEP